MGFPTDKATKTWEHAGLQCAIAPAASTRMKQLAVVAQRIAEIAGSTR